MTQYILRFDDITPEYLSTKEWSDMNIFLDKLQLKVILGVIPYPQDKKLNVNGDYEKGIEILKKLNKEGHLIAMHGCHHKLKPHNSNSLVPINNYGEFSGKSKFEQKILLQKSFKWFINNGITPKLWMAPAHDFDKITIECLKEIKIKVITDGLFFGPRLKKGMIWIPQQIWGFKKMPFGCWTICIHMIEMKKISLTNLKISIKKNLNKFIDPSKLCNNSFLIKNFSFLDDLTQFFALRFLKLKKIFYYLNTKLKKIIKK